MGRDMLAMPRGDAGGGGEVDMEDDLIGCGAVPLVGVSPEDAVVM